MPLLAMSVNRSAGRRAVPAALLSVVPACARYGWFVLVVEMLGATSTITYGLNIVFDPVHEPLEYEAGAPGITKVRARLCKSPGVHAAAFANHHADVVCGCYLCAGRRATLFAPAYTEKEDVG